MKKIIIIFGLICLLIVLPIYAIQPTQQYNKIYLNPFYLNSMAVNTNYTYTVDINPPDKVSSIVNAIISFNGQINGQTQTFTLWVNGKACNNPTYSVATAFSTTGNVQFSFDCSNTITKSGKYNVTMKSAVATGAMNGWVDLTYMNNPQGTSTIFGTEYYEGDDATIFLLLKDANGIPISNGTCSIDIYYPNIANLSHPEWLDNAAMLYKEEGLYYYDFTVPLTTGLYMVNAQCTYSTLNNFYYTLDKGFGPTRTATAGTYTGDTFVLNDYTEWLYTQCSSSSGSPKTCDAYYEWTGLTSNLTRLDVLYLGENTLSATMIMYWWNWSSSAWIALPNTLTFSSTAAGGVPSGIDEYLANNIPVSNHSIKNNTVRVRLYSSAGSTFKQYSNWLTLRASQPTTTIQELKGSGEVHVSSVPPGENRFFKTLSCNGFTDGRCDIFTNDDEFDLQEGEIESYLNISATSTKNDISISITTPFSVDCTALYWIKEYNGVSWVDFTDYTLYSQPAYENCIVTLNKDIISGTEYQFWFKYDNYMKWEVEWTKKISNAVNDSVRPLCNNRNFTYINPITDSTPITNNIITDFCYQFYDDQYWINSYYDDSLSVDIAGEFASYVQEMRYYRNTLIDKYTFLILGNNTNLMSDYYATKTWNYTTRNLTWFPTQLQASDVWNYTNRNLTYYPNVTANINYSAISTNVWNYSGNISTSITSQVANVIWNYVGRYVHGIIYT